jgi:hypothetical protein
MRGFFFQYSSREKNRFQFSGAENNVASTCCPAMNVPSGAPPLVIQHKYDSSVQTGTVTIQC